MKKYILNRLAIFSLVFSFALINVPTADAQCPMCKMSAEQNLKDGGTAGKGLNRGILYMLATPYLLVAGIGLVWYRNRKREEEEEAGDDPLNEEMSFIEN